jgi:hypothetical protein
MVNDYFRVEYFTPEHCKNCLLPTQWKALGHEIARGTTDMAKKFDGSQVLPPIPRLDLTRQVGHRPSINPIRQDGTRDNYERRTLCEKR